MRNEKQLNAFIIQNIHVIRERLRLSASERFSQETFFLRRENKTLPLLLTYGWNNKMRNLKIYLFSQHTKIKREEIKKSECKRKNFLSP